MVDCLGLLFAVVVSTVGVRGRRVVALLLGRVRDRRGRMTLVGAEGGYAGCLVVWAQGRLQLVRIVNRWDGVSGFVVVSR